MKKNIFIALLFIGGLTACSDNNEGSDIPDNPGYPVTHFSKIELKEVKEEPGAPAVTVTQTYDYSAGRLINFTSTQSFVAGGELFKIVFSYFFKKLQSFKQLFFASSSLDSLHT